MSARFLSLAVACVSALSSAACSAAPQSTGDVRLDSARAAVTSDFASPRDVSFRGEQVVEVTGTEGSKATVVCGEVNRRGRDISIREGWRFFYYVVSYDPVPVYGPPNFRAQLNDEPGAFDKISLPPIYAAGDYAVLFGPDDASINDSAVADTFGRSWAKFCTGNSAPISEHTLQTYR